MQIFILLCFDKKAVVYSVKGESVQECRFRGNETLSLEWGDERFAEVWEYFEDVYDVSSWENTEILIYCVNKKEVSLWDKVRYPVFQNVKGVTIEKIAQVLPKFAMAKGLLKKEYIVFSWRNHTWKVMRDFCEPCEDKAEYEVSDFDFAELISQFLSVKSQESMQAAVSMQANLRENQKLSAEFEQIKQSLEQISEELQKEKQEKQDMIRQLKQLQEENAYLQKNSQDLQEKAKPFENFAQSKSRFLQNPNMKENARAKEIIEWTKDTYQKIETLYHITEELHNKAKKNEITAFNYEKEIDRKILSHEIDKEDWIKKCPISDELLKVSFCLKSNKNFDTIFSAIVGGWKFYIKDKIGSVIVSNFDKLKLAQDIKTHRNIYKTLNEYNIINGIKVEKINDFINILNEQKKMNAQNAEDIFLMYSTFYALDKDKNIIDKFIALEKEFDTAGKIKISGLSFISSSGFSRNKIMFNK